jgi:hypothetical protein
MRVHREAEPGAECDLCGRTVAKRTRHHLCPREHGGTEVAMLCPPCHKQVHALYSNNTLRDELDTLEKLKAQPAIQGYLRWVRRQPDRHIRVHTSRTRR